jgi:colicin import membrane protein
MTARSPSALLLSATLHAALVGLILLFTYALETQVKDPPKVFELVAGPGDDYAATQAPALGVEGGIKLTLPEPSAPIFTPPAQAVSPPAESTPEPQVTPAPVQKPVTQAPPKSTASKTPDFSQQIKRKIIRAESRAKLEIKREREAEQKRLTKEEFDRQNKAAKAAAAGGNPNVKHIDAEGIAGGVVGGSASSKSGAGGKALTSEQRDLLDAYFAVLKDRMQKNLDDDKPTGVSDSLSAVAECYVGADGSVSGATIIRSSGNVEFDQAVINAIRRYRSIGARPDHNGDRITMTFRMKEEDGG